MKPVLMIHEVNHDILDLPLEDYTLTFDDALYSQFHYYPILQKIDTRKILFVSGKYICKGRWIRQPHPAFFYSTTAEDARQIFDHTNGTVDHHYMTLDEIKVMKSVGFEIGGHGYDHIREYPEDLKKKVEVMTDDVERMFYWMENEIGVKPTSYCYPFNKEDGMLKEILKRKDITEFFGVGRFDVNELSYIVSD